MATTSPQRTRRSTSGSWIPTRTGATISFGAMRFPSFDMERMQSTWEHRVKYDLSESGVEALMLEEITRDAKELMRTPLGYAEGVGREATRALVASFHAGSAPDDVVITTGTSEANERNDSTIASRPL